MTILNREQIADRLLNARGHETYAYGQGSYDGDACRACSWQGPPRSAQAHQDETRRALLVKIVGDALDAERVKREAAEKRFTDLRDAVLAWLAENPFPIDQARSLREVVARVERGES